MNISQKQSLGSSQQQSFPGTGVWEELSQKFGSKFPRTGHRAVIMGQYLVIIGGRKRSNSANLIMFDLKNLICQKVEIFGRKPKSSLCSHSACHWKDNQIIVYGGRDDKNKGVSSEVGIITLSMTERIIFLDDLFLKTFHSNECTMDNYTDGRFFSEKKAYSAYI